MLKFSIITVCFNSANTIVETINSVHSQSFKSYEHLIIDGLSTDGTVDIAKSHQSDKIILFSEKDDGLYDAMNKGMFKAKGEYIIFLNSDDLFADEFVLEKINLLAINSPDFIYGGISYFSDNVYKQRTWIPESFKYIKEKKIQLPHPAICIKRLHLIEKNRLFDTKLKIAADLKQQLEIIHCDNRTGILIDEVLVNMRLGGKSTRNFVAFLLGWKEALRVYRDIFGITGYFYCFRKIIQKLPQIKKNFYLKKFVS